VDRGVMTTPREQLIDLIERVEVRYDLGDYARSVVQALEKQGAFVFLPVKAAELTEGQEFVESLLYDFVGMGKRDDDGGFFCWNADKHYAGDDTVYVNALEIDQS
jgi:hypothetical protein